MTAADFQALASKQGRHFENQCRLMLAEYFGEDPVGPIVHPIGVEIDLAVGGIWFECKGSWRGQRPGLLRTDTLKKAIYSGAMLSVQHGARPYIVLTSHLPAVGSAGARQLAIAIEQGWVADAVAVHAPGALEAALQPFARSSTP